MNLQTTTHAGFQGGLAEAIAGGSLPAGFPELGTNRTHSGPVPHTMDELQPFADLEEDAGLGAMTGLGVAMMFNAGLALAGLIGWEFWIMLH